MCHIRYFLSSLLHIQNVVKHDCSNLHPSKFRLSIKKLILPITFIIRSLTTVQLFSLVPLPMAAALLNGKTFHTRNRLVQELRERPNKRFPTFMRCQNRSDLEELEPKTNKGRENRPFVLRVLAGVVKFGEGLRETLSPKQKGDWKDLVLMSLSFAVYVYMSQKIVCAYCLWMSMLK